MNLAVVGEHESLRRVREQARRSGLAVPFGHPRDGNALRTDPRFGEMRAHIWNPLHTARPQHTRTPREVA